MNTLDLVERIAGDYELTKVAAKAIVDDLLDTIVTSARKGDEVALAGFGKFKVKSRAARTGRNPQTGAAVKIAASKRLSFLPAKAVKEALNGAKRKSKPVKKAGKKR